MNWTAFLESRGATFDTSGLVKDFGTTEGVAHSDWITDLSHIGLLDIRGSGAGEFLHKQLTMNVVSLADGQAMMTAWCNPKGRALASLILYRLPDAYGLLLSADLIDTVGKRLQMFVLRADVTITDPGANRPRIGVMGPDAAGELERYAGRVPVSPWETTSADQLAILRLPAEPPRFLLTGPAAKLADLWQALESVCRPVEPSQWRLADIETGIPWVTAATSEAFLPQMLDLDRTGGLVYDKGCYPGQEVIARLHYRGEVKQRLVRGQTDKSPPAAGTPLYDADGQRAGSVLDAAAIPAGSSILAVAVPGQETLQLGSPRGARLILESTTAC